MNCPIPSGSSSDRRCRCHCGTGSGWTTAGCSTGSWGSSAPGRLAKRAGAVRPVGHAAHTLSPTGAGHLRAHAPGRPGARRRRWGHRLAGVGRLHQVLIGGVQEPDQLLPTLVAGGVLASGGETSSAAEDGADRVHGPWDSRPRTRPRFLHHPCLGCRWPLFTRLGPQRPCAVQYPRGVLQRHQRVRNPPIAHGNGGLLRVLAPTDAEDGAS